MVSFRVHQEDSQRAVNKVEIKEAGKLKKGAIYAGDVNLSQDNVTIKRLQSGRAAMKGVLDQRSTDKKIDDDLISRQQRIAESQEESSILNKQKLEVEQRIEELKKTYAITEDNTGTDNKEYQDKVQSLKEQSLEYQKKMDKAVQTISSESSTIRGIKQSLLKRTVTMDDAVREEETIRKVSAKDIVGELLNESIQHIDEVIKEQEEKQEEKQEEEAAKETETKNKEQTLTTLTAEVDKIQEELQAIMEKNKMLEEDMKGLAVDNQV